MAERLSLTEIEQRAAARTDDGEPMDLASPE